MKTLIIGASSFIGKRVMALFNRGAVTGTFSSHPIPGGVHFDICTMELEDAVLDLRSYTHAIVLSADPKPDSCYRNQEKTSLLNVTGTKRLISSLLKAEITPIFASTEFVFDGAKGNYVETDLPKPILVYGAQKLEIERFLQETTDNFVIARIAKTFGSDEDDGTFFSSWIKDLKRGERKFHCAADQIFSPIYVDEVAQAFKRLVDVDARGIFHIAGAAAKSRIELLRSLLTHLRTFAALEVEIQPCSINDFGLPEHRPLNVSMLPDKLIRETGVVLKEPEYWCKFITEKLFLNSQLLQK